MSGIKKYCGLGLLALLTTAYLTSSCTDNDFSGSVIDAKKQAFSDIFIEAYGQPDPQQTWGFGTSSTRAFTRAAEPRANEWAATYKVPEPLSEGQKNRVMKYFQYNQYPGGTTMNISNYFVQQVYKGGDKPLGNGTNGYSTETYLAANQETYITGGSNMDKLTAGTQHEHVNNFNYGNCGWNYNVLDNDQPINGGSVHSDQIMLMLNTPTTCMGYWNSNGTYGHDDRYRLVSAEEIDRWATAHPELLDEVDAPAQDDWNRDFVGFDFSQVPSDNILVKTNEKWENNVLVDYDLVYATINDGPKTYEYIWDGTQTIKITDENRAQYLYLTNAYGYPVPFLDNQRNKYCGYERKKDNGDFLETAQYDATAENNNSIEITDVPYTHTVDGGGTQTDNVGPALNLKFIKKMIADGYYPIQEQFRTWVSPRDCADGYYSDWIVSLVQAETKNGGGDNPSGNYENITVQEIIDGRIFCEDLGSAQRTDIDYNDVVFDAQTYLTHTFTVPYTMDNGNKVYDYSNPTWVSTAYNKTDINLLAAGGTIDISVADEDVNVMMGIGKTTMANTYVAGVSPNQSGYTNFANEISPVKFTVSNPSYEQLINIPICVRYNEEVSELTAYVGDTPQKLCTPMGSPWSAERVEMNTAYPGFAAWANNKNNPEPWYSKNVGKLYNVKFVSNSTENQIGGTIADWEVGEGAIKLSGKGKTAGEEKFVTITLDQPLAVGDQIAITAFRKKDNNAVGSLYFLFDNNYVIADEQVYNNKYYGSQANTFIWTVDEHTAGCRSFKLSRNLTGTNVYIDGITIIGGLGPQRTTTATNSGMGGGGTGTGEGGGSGSGSSGPSFGTITGTTVYSGNPTTLSSGNGMNIDASNFNNVAAADVYIYGTGSGSVDVNGAQTEDVTSGATSAPGFNFTNGFGFTRTVEEPVVKKCTLGPKQFHGNDLGITGNNFTVYYVSYVDATQKSVSKPEGTTLWSGTKSMDDWGTGQIKVDAYYLDGIGNGTIIRVAGIGFADNENPGYDGTSWQVQLCNNHPDKWVNIETKNIWSEEKTGVVTVEFELDANEADSLLAGQLVIQGINFIAKYVTMDNSGVTTDNGGGTGDGGGATATINLVTSDISLTGGVVAIVGDQPTAQAYANRIVTDTSKLVAKIQVNADDSWYFKIGPRGNTGDGIMPEKNGSNNNGSEYTYETTITSELLEKIKSNANDGWWSGGMFGAQGYNVVLKELKLINCAAAE